MTLASGWAGILCSSTAAIVYYRDPGDLQGVEKPSCSGRATIPVAFTSRDRLRWRSRPRPKGKAKPKPRRHLRLHLEDPTRIRGRGPLVNTFPREGVDSVCNFGAEVAGSRQLGVPENHSSSSAVASGSISPGDNDHNDDDFNSTITSTLNRTLSRQEHTEQWMKLYEENEIVFTDESWGALQQEEKEEEEKIGGSVPDWVQEKWRLALAAGRAQNASKVLVWGGSLAFVQQLCQVVPPDAVVVAHLALSVLGAIKEMDDDVQCWYGDVLDVSPSYGPFNTVFLNSLVATAESLDHVLGGVARLCSAGARIVICHAGREEDLQTSRAKDHHLAISSLPGGADLASMTDSLPLNLVDLQDRPAVYLATLEVAETGGQSHGPSGSGEASDARRMPLQQTPSDLKSPPPANGEPVVQGFGRGSKTDLPESATIRVEVLLNQNGATPVTSKGTQTVVQLPELIETGRVSSGSWTGEKKFVNQDSWLTSNGELPIQGLDSENVERWRWEEADESVSHSSDSSQEGVEEEDSLRRSPSLGVSEGGLEEVSSIQEPRFTNELEPSKEEDVGKRSHTTSGVLDILARDLEVLQEGMRWMKQALLLSSSSQENADKRSTMRGAKFDRSSGNTVKDIVAGLESVQETAESLRSEKTGVTNALARDANIEDAQVIFRTGKEKAKAEVETLKSSNRSRSNPALEMLKTATAKLGGVTDSLARASKPLSMTMETMGSKTGPEKNSIKTNLKSLMDALRHVKEKIDESLRMRGWEDATFVPQRTRHWPQPIYNGLRGRDLLMADIDALKAYSSYVREFFDTWRIPLHSSYDATAVASYFNRRPHILVFRLLEVTAAFTGVALQLLLDKASLSLFTRNSDLDDEDGDEQSTLRTAETLKRTLLSLGPTFIKVAQSLSARPDLIGTNTAKVLSELQDRLPPFPTQDAMAVIENELGVPAAEVFPYLSEDPVAAASFGQVYKGRTLDGEEVAVKVQRPDLLYNVARDIYVLRLVLGVLRKLAKMNSDIAVLADELGQGLFGELDYTLEAANAREFGSAHRNLTFVKVPKTFHHLTRKRVLTMEWIDGSRPLDLQLVAEGSDINVELAGTIQRHEAKHRLNSLVIKGVECSLVQLLETGVMHADPHPGNLLYTDEGILAYLDFGLLARVEKKHRAAMLAVIAHLVNGEWHWLANDFADLDILKPTTDRFALRMALERAFGSGPDAVVKNGVPDFQFGQVTGKLWKVALKFRFRLPAYYTLVLRSLASLEGIAVSIDPDYKVFAAAYPYVIRRLLTDNSVSSREVLRSLVLTEGGEFRWDRLAGILATSSRKPSLGKVTEEKAYQPTLNLREPQGAQLLNDRDNLLALSLGSFALSNSGSPVRRVLLQADTKSLAKAFLSNTANGWRRKVAFALAGSLYISILNFALHVESKMSGSSALRRQWSERETVRIMTGMAAAGSPQQTSLPRPSSTMPLLKERRLWFLLKVLASRLTGSPVLLLRVGWAFVAMVAFAAAVAAHQFAITLSDLLLSPKSKTASSNTTAGKPADDVFDPRLQGGFVNVLVQ